MGHKVGIWITKEYDGVEYEFGLTYDYYFEEFDFHTIKTLGELESELKLSDTQYKEIEELAWEQI